MGFLAIGINHKTASIEVREKVSFAPEQMVEALGQAKQLGPVSEVAILSTCNRTELYCSTSDNDHQAVIQWLASYHSLSAEDLERCSYIHRDSDAVRHIMRVASGLDSMVLGEPQILGQLKSSFAVAKEASSVGAELGRLFQTTFSMAKRVRTHTTIGENPVSVAYAAVSLGKQIFSDMSQSNALLVGAGETIELVARHLREAGVKRITVANRTLERAKRLAQEFDAHAILLSDIPDHLVDADIVIASTASQLPILGKGAVERALKKRKHRPMFMVDIAVPRDIEPEVGELADVYLYTVDDLREVVEENQKSRQKAAESAESMVVVGVQEFEVRQRELDSVGILKAYRKQAEQIKQAELDKALKQLEKGDDAEVVLTQLARSLTNKMVHAPSIQIKKASAEGRKELVEWSQQLFQLDLQD
ncbi:glutamyl-tRNA reductase [Aestuariirhabdus sp. LZHN29]|uniref:glutamyl-tRNA reductase n=1 Tax=Aestuariirhabdus sp. LZHN29 TaxID=3417462 RepID=UPI003CF0E10C